MINRANFDNWFASYIRNLHDDQNAGLVLTMISFPLLERYLRQLTRSEPNSTEFLAGLQGLLSVLRTHEMAQAFWSAYRNDILHIATLSTDTHRLTHQSPHPVEVQEDGKVVWLNPFLFSKWVLETIESNFETFERGVPLATENYYGRVPDPPGTPNAYTGTGAPPGQSGGKF